MNRFLLLLTALTLTACIDNAKSASGHTGMLVDGPVANIGYRTETRQGMTDAQGRFHYDTGEHVTFFIGNVEFPAVAARPTLTPLDLAGTTDLNAPAVVNMVRLLQTIDQDGDASNGIQVSSLAAWAGGTLDFNLPGAEFEASADVLAFIASAGQQAPATALVGAGTALDNFRQALSFTPLDRDVVQSVPVAAIAVDGDASDWAGIRPVAVDTSGDQRDATLNADVVRVALARDDLNIYVLVQMNGAVVPFGTPGLEELLYQVNLQLHAADDCGHDILATMPALAWSSADPAYVPSATFAYAGNVLEAAFPTANFLDGVASFDLDPRITALAGAGGSFSLVDALDGSACFRVPAYR